MKRPDARHYTEEELLMYMLEEEPEENMHAIGAHIRECAGCGGVYREFEELQASVPGWGITEMAEQTWQTRKLELLEMLRRDKAWFSGRGIFGRLRRTFQAMWDYALNNPLPALGYVAAAVAFASERTITVFRLDQILPATNEVFKFLKQVL